MEEAKSEGMKRDRYDEARGHGKQKSGPGDPEKCFREVTTVRRTYSLGVATAAARRTERGSVRRRYASFVGEKLAG